MRTDKKYSEWNKKNSKEPVEVIPYPCIQAFSSPVWIFEITHPEKLNKKLTEFAYRQKELTENNEPIENKSNRGGWHSETNMQEHEECWDIVSLIEIFVRRILTESQYEYKEIPPFRMNISMWCNINSPGHSNGMHTHPGCHYSGCYYVKVPDGDSGKFEAYNPIYPGKNPIIPTNDKYFTARHKLQPAEGRFVFFKSDTHHEVTINNTDEDRISFAFNITLIKKSSEEDQYEP
jgi:uncharacterized protein (TIGR02466 family)